MARRAAAATEQEAKANWGQSGVSGPGLGDLTKLRGGGEIEDAENTGEGVRGSREGGCKYVNVL